ncbi:MAG: hypothetical protein ABT01_02285 [Clostridium sp. SCN 57-10]|nr:MAG: hypothetical protein ABT01_02285 [Clostridium sp. SCN 57-10]
MYVGSLWALRGTVRIRVRGASTERFLNACARDEILFRDAERTGADTMLMTVYARDFRRLRSHARREFCAVRVVKKSGGPFLWRRARRRVALLLSVALCAVLLIVLSSYIWTVEITGCERVTEREIAAALAEFGVRPGAPVRGINPDRIRLEVLTLDARLSYLTITVSGTHVDVLVHERRVTPERVADDVPCDVVADKTGIVESMQVLDGLTTVRVGSAVLPGDVLVHGEIVSQQGTVWYTHAAANISLRTRHTLRWFVPLDRTVFERTGKTKKRYAVSAFGRTFALYNIEKEPFSCYDTVIERKQLGKSAGVRLPFYLTVETLYETQPREAEIDTKALADTLRQRMHASLARTIGEQARIVKENYVWSEGEGRLYGTLHAECIESCGVQKPLGGTNDGTNH